MNVDPVVLDGATLIPEAVAKVARGGASVTLSPAGHERNDAARGALTALLGRGEDLYGVTTGLGALRLPGDADGPHPVLDGPVCSHACGAGRPLAVEVVRAAMVTRANQIGAGGARIHSPLHRPGQSAVATRMRALLDGLERRARKGGTLHAMRVGVATELVVAVRALRLASYEPVGAGTRPLYEAAAARLDPEIGDRALHPDVEAARMLLEQWSTKWRG